MLLLCSVHLDPLTQLLSILAPSVHPSYRTIPHRSAQHWDWEWSSHAQWPLAEASQSKLPCFVTAVPLSQNIAFSHRTFLCKGWDNDATSFVPAYLKKWDRRKGNITTLRAAFWWQPGSHRQASRPRWAYWPSWLLASIAKTQSAPTLHTVQPTLARTFN